MSHLEGTPPAHGTGEHVAIGSSDRLTLRTLGSITRTVTSNAEQQD